MSNAECCTTCRAPLAPGAASCSACGTVVWLYGPTPRPQPARAAKQPFWTRRRLAAAGLAAVVGAVTARWAFDVARKGGDSPSQVADRVVPVVSVDQGTATLHATLPNGTVVVLTYPADLDLAGLGAQAYTTVELPDPAASTATYQCCSYSVAFSYATVADLYPSATPAATYNGGRGAIVRLFHPSQRRTPPSGDRSADQLVFTFGRWVAEIPVVQGLQREPARVDLTANLHADIQPDGFPVLRNSGDVPRGPEMGTGITFGDPTVAPQVRILTGFCSDPGSNTAVRRPIDHPGTESGLIWCDDDTKLLIAVMGPTNFTTALGEQLKVRISATR